MTFFAQNHFTATFYFRAKMLRLVRYIAFCQCFLVLSNKLKDIATLDLSNGRINYIDIGD